MRVKNGSIAIINGERKEKTTIFDTLRKIFDIDDGSALSEEEVIRLMEIQTLISNEKKISLSFEGLKSFLLRAMNYNGFQVRENEEDKESRFKEFLSTVTDEEVLALYDVEENYDRKNLHSIDNLISTSRIDSSYRMQVNESGNGTIPTITLDSRKKLAKSLLNRDN